MTFRHLVQTLFSPEYNLLVTCVVIASNRTIRKIVVLIPHRATAK